MTLSTRPHLATAAAALMSAALGALGAIGAGGLAGCGDNLAAISDDAGPDAGAPGSTAFVVAGVFMGGDIASTIAIPSLRVTANAVAGVSSSDPVVRAVDGRIYIINRFGHDNVTILDAATMTLVGQISTGAGTNPQDVAVRGSTVYAVALNEPDVFVLDADDPDAGVVRTIALPALDTDDGVPDCHSIALADDRLYVSCGILDFSAFPVVARGPGKIVVINTAGDAVVTVLDLTHENPFGFLQPTPADGALGGDLLVATVDFGDLDGAGCIERIRVGAEPAAAGCVVTNAELDGYASGVAYGADDTLYIGVTSGFDADGTAAQVRAFDAADSALDPTPVTAPGQRGFDVAACPTGEIVVADAAGGMRVYAADGSELSAGLLDIGLPPVGNGAVCF